MAKKWEYGDPSPTSWKEASDVLKGLQKPKKKKGPGLFDRIAALEKLLKEKK